MTIATGEQATADDILIRGAGHLVIAPHAYSVINQGTWTISTHASSAYNYGWNNSATNNDGDEIDYEVWMAKGTYTLELITRHGIDLGIIDVDIDGVEVATFDEYNGSNIYNQVDRQTSIVVATSGMKTITVRIDGKNGSATDHRAYINAITFFRTA